MKKQSKKILLIALLLFVMFGVSGCSDDNDDYYGSSQNVRDCYEAGYCKTVWK